MAILTAAKLISALMGKPSHNNPQYLHLPHAATDSYQGSIMMLDLATGYVKVVPLCAPGTSAGVNPVLGILRGSYLKGNNRKDSDNCINSAGAAGDRIAIIETGIFPITNDATTALAAEHVGRPCFAMDDNNVSANPLSYNRPQAGLFVGLNSAGVPMVAMGPHIPNRAITIETALANAALTQYTAVKLITDTGIAEYAAQATDTGLFSGVVINAPDGVTKMALVVTNGPCPVVAGAAGFTVATELMVTTAGAMIAATAAKVVTGQALETATNGQTRMMRVAPRQLAA